MNEFNKYLRHVRYAIAQCRHEAGLTQEQLSERVEVASSFIAMLETGDRKPNLKMLYRLAVAMSIQPSELLHLAESIGNAGAKHDASRLS